VVLTFFIAGLLYLLRFERVDNLGAYSIPSETGLLIPSVIDSWLLRLWNLALKSVSNFNRSVDHGHSVGSTIWAVFPSRAHQLTQF
jgi:hypothetical protein